MAVDTRLRMVDTVVEVDTAVEADMFVVGAVDNLYRHLLEEKEVAPLASVDKTPPIEQPADRTPPIEMVDKVSPIESADNTAEVGTVAADPGRDLAWFLLSILYMTTR